MIISLMECYRNQQVREGSGGAGGIMIVKSTGSACRMPVLAGGFPRRLREKGVSDFLVK